MPGIRPPIELSYYSTVAQIMPVLFIAFVGELGLAPLVRTVSTEANTLADRLRRQSTSSFDRWALLGHAQSYPKMVRRALLAGALPLLAITGTEVLCLEVLGNHDPSSAKGIAVAVGVGVSGLGLATGIVTLARNAYRRSLILQAIEDLPNP